jgi:hypothetical protein
MENESNQEKNLSSYQNFVQHFQDNQYSQSHVGWSKEREDYIKNDLNKRKIILQEINQFDFKVL